MTLSCNMTGFDRSAKLTVGVFLFQSDETELLSDWLQYYSYLFGIEHLTVVDHNSKNPSICKLLSLYQACGMRLVDHTGPFSQKWLTLSHVMKNVSSKYTFLLPLDADEFITVPTFASGRRLIYTNDSFSSRKILKVFSRLPIDGRKYKTDNSLTFLYSSQTCKEGLVTNNYSEPNQVQRFKRRTLRDGNSSYFVMDHNLRLRKTFYHSTGFISTDQGNHLGLVENDIGKFRMTKNNMSKYFIETRFIYNHLGFLSYRKMQQKMIRGADAYGYTNTSDCDAKTVPGRHYCKAAKNFRLENQASKDQYMMACTGKHNFTSISHNGGLVMRNWFAANTLSMEDLVGYLSD